MLKERVITALIASALLFAVLYAVPPAVARLVIVAVILVAAWEWSGFLSLDSPASRAGYVALVGLLQAGLFALVWRGLPAADVYLAALGWWLVALGWLCLYSTRPTRIPAVVPWLAGALVLVPAWLALDALYLIEPGLLLFMLIVVWAADIGAYFSGKRFGRVKLAPHISPGKTWEGVIGGLVLVAALVVVRGLWVGNALERLLPFCLAVAMVSVIGDLTVSLFKRNAGVKDSGRLFPGHGGLLDRVDSVAAAAPLFALGVGMLGLQ